MNTCTVREQAEHKAKSNLGRLRVWKEADPHRILIVAGCAASLWGDSIQKRYPFIDLVAPATRIEEFPQLIAASLKERWDWQQETQNTFPSTANTLSELPAVAESTVHPFLFGDSETAYVTIMRGCNYSCSYCIVPQVRGRELYRSMPEILSEINEKVRQGFREVMLLGQTVNSYYYRTEGRGLRTEPALETQHSVLGFSDLLRAVNAVEGLERIRFMSPHPRHMRDTVIQAMAESEKVCRHVHLPAQSGSTRILEKMNRLYSREEYIGIVHKLRSAMPGLKITTDLIAGFPGETDEDFAQTLSFLEEVQFDGLFAFKYSPRPGTTSAALTDDVAEDVKESRLQQILALNKEIKQSHSWAN
jgi:tRNA-2-methylthio-N6-dimethylallyladenosine synthase